MEPPEEIGVDASRDPMGAIITPDQNGCAAGDLNPDPRITMAPLCAWPRPAQISLDARDCQSE